MVAEFISRKGTQFAAHFTLMLGSLRGLRIKRSYRMVFIGVSVSKDLGRGKVE